MIYKQKTNTTKTITKPVGERLSVLRDPTSYPFTPVCEILHALRPPRIQPLSVNAPSLCPKGGERSLAISRDQIGPHRERNSLAAWMYRLAFTNESRAYWSFDALIMLLRRRKNVSLSTAFVKMSAIM